MIPNVMLLCAAAAVRPKSFAARSHSLATIEFLRPYAAVLTFAAALLMFLRQHSCGGRAEAAGISRLSKQQKLEWKQ